MVAATARRRWAPGPVSTSYSRWHPWLASAPFTVLLGVLTLGERMSSRQVAGIALAVGGMALIAIDRAAHGASAAVVPVLLTLLGALGWACGPT